VLEREQIYTAVWGYAMPHGDRSIDVYVRKLRHKLAAASPDWSYLHTHYRIGYRFEPRQLDPAADAPAARPSRPREDRPTSQPPALEIRAAMEISRA
jgi:DNA-binding winged helix-turn-helix (wHTH) protein